MVIGPDFVFLAVPRTASQTLTYHFLPKYGGESLGADDYHRMDVPPEHAHKFTFAVVRNPYDRMLSLWYLIQKFTREDLEKDGILRDWTPAQFVDWCATQSCVKWQPQAKLLSAWQVVHVLRFERLEEGLRSLPFVGDEFEMPAIQNSTARRNILEDLTREFVEEVNKHSVKDFIRFGYTML